MILTVARRRDLADPGGEVLSDARNFSQRRLLERREFVRVIAGDLRDVAIGPDFERVIAPDFEEVGDLPKDLGDRGVIQSANLGFRRESRAVARRPVAGPQRSIDVPLVVRNRTGSLRLLRRKPSPPSPPPPLR